MFNMFSKKTYFSPQSPTSCSPKSNPVTHAEDKLAPCPGFPSLLLDETAKEGLREPRVRTTIICHAFNVYVDVYGRTPSRALGIENPFCPYKVSHSYGGHFGKSHFFSSSFQRNTALALLSLRTGKRVDSVPPGVTFKPHRGLRCLLSKGPPRKKHTCSHGCLPSELVGPSRVLCLSKNTNEVGSPKNASTLLPRFLDYHDHHDGPNQVLSPSVRRPSGSLAALRKALLWQSSAPIIC